ncbi:F-box/kelch-repeat protein At1g16250 [Selaginella moellendorffii]|uniref:F-box/kelch-repeat protein At1g16250 n=1 Tax=Selaginella moellendorffii TaxID=88036 RepID=UPI000D1C699B|nr:F-box/kelch-repeat protein At1g16250 [Selaginella moellendorffii]|eukprot:XP_024533151.1 F-box/kelch-repeat protein At1g16250 [Selaginella moellendorffii]
MATTLIPGLDDDAAYQCLLRVTLPSHGQMRQVSRAWRNLVSSAKFYDDRSAQGLDEEWLVATVMLRQETLIMAFNPNSAKKAWMILPSPPQHIHGIAGFECKALGGKLYLLGGWRGKKLVSVFDSHTNRWSAAAPMLCPRAHCASAAMEGRLYVVGGNLMGKGLDAEVYDPVEDRWEPLPQSPSPETIAFHIAIVVDRTKMAVFSRGGVGATLVFSARDLSWEVADTGLPGRRCFVHSNRIYEADMAGSLMWRYERGKNMWEALRLTNASSSDDRFFFRTVSCQKNIWAVSMNCKVVTVIQVPSDGGLEAKVVAVHKLSVPFSDDPLVLRTFDVDILRA